MAPCPALLLVAGSFATFRLLNQALQWLVPLPPSARRNHWKWRNIWTSLVHSVLSGGGALARPCLYLELPEDVAATQPPGALSLVAVSVGYLLEDFVDMLCNQKLRQSWELLFHHSVVIACFGVAVLRQQHVGFTLVALLVEINSVFLHLRQILLVAGLGRTARYRLNSVAHLGTHAAFRVAALAWMARWLLLHRRTVPAAAFAVSAAGVAVAAPTNLVLLYRLLRSDCFNPCGRRSGTSRNSPIPQAPGDGRPQRDGQGGRGAAQSEQGHLRTALGGSALTRAAGRSSVPGAAEKSLRDLGLGSCFSCTFG